MGGLRPGPTEPNGKDGTDYTIPILSCRKQLLYYTILIPIVYQCFDGFMHACIFDEMKPYKNVKRINSFPFFNISCPYAK